MRGRFESPLRYPGGKGHLYPYVNSILEDNNYLGCHYYEPFAGGAGLALRLLFEGKVRTITLNDKDPAIFSFWMSILHETDAFVELVETTEVNIKMWHDQKLIWEKKTSNHLELGFAAFFLNRTNRSGILAARPIGGLKQDGAYKIDCRFNKDDLIKRIRRIAKHKDKIKCTDLDANDFLLEFDSKSAFFFIDPPYYVQGKSLYMNHYNHNDHENLSKTIKSLKGSWLLSYDNAEEITEMYLDVPRFEKEVSYTLSRKRKEKEQFFISTNLSS